MSEPEALQKRCSQPGTDQPGGSVRRDRRHYDGYHGGLL